MSCAANRASCNRCVPASTHNQTGPTRYGRAPESTGRPSKRRARRRAGESRRRSDATQRGNVPSTCAWGLLGAHHWQMGYQQPRASGCAQKPGIPGRGNKQPAGDRRAAWRYPAECPSWRLFGNCGLRRRASAPGCFASRHALCVRTGGMWRPPAGGRRCAPRGSRCGPAAAWYPGERRHTVPRATCRGGRTCAAHEGFCPLPCWRRPPWTQAAKRRASSC